MAKDSYGCQHPKLRRFRSHGYTVYECLTCKQQFDQEDMDVLARFSHEREIVSG